MAIVSSYSALTAQLGPLAQWRFDEAGGGVAVDRANGLDGSYRGSVSFGESGASGGSFAVELAAFGDSLVAGFGLGGSSNFLNAQLEALLDARGLDSTVTAFGQNGRSTGRALGAVQGVIDSELFAPYHGNTLDVAALNRGDGVHPNAAGVAQIASRLAPQAMLAAAASGALIAPSEPLLLADGTIELWFNADDVAARQGLFSKDAAGEGTGGQISAALQNGLVSVGLEGLSEGAFVQGAVQAETDTHLVFTFGAGGMQLFLNGALIDGSPNRGADELRGEGGRDALSGSLGADDLFGGKRGDLLRGNGGRDTLRGGDGPDDIFGNRGADRIDGGSGNDLIDGGSGPDLQTGGPGADRFVIARLADRIDRITDFDVGAGGDVLDGGSILRGFQPGSSRVADFVRLASSDGALRVAVDDDGAGSEFTAMADLAGVSGVNLNQLVTDGNLALT